MPRVLPLPAQQRQALAYLCQRAQAQPIPNRLRQSTQTLRVRAAALRQESAGWRLALS